jgi:hypothetical protein
MKLYFHFKVDPCKIPQETNLTLIVCVKTNICLRSKDKNLKRCVMNTEWDSNPRLVA